MSAPRTARCSAALSPNARPTSSRADVIQFSEPATALDFQKRGGYASYVSPQAEFYAPEHLSKPAGDYFWVGVTFAGLAYNTEKVKPEDAPKGWKDITKPVWLNGANAKMSNSGMQFVQWYELRKLYGDKFWGEFAKNRPRGFDLRAQQFERLAKGDDKLCVLAEYAGYLLVKEKGAPVAFVAPETACRRARCCAASPTVARARKRRACSSTGRCRCAGKTTSRPTSIFTTVRSARMRRRCRAASG